MVWLFIKSSLCKRQTLVIFLTHIDKILTVLGWLPTLMSARRAQRNSWWDLFRTKSLFMSSTHIFIKISITNTLNYNGMYIKCKVYIKKTLWGLKYPTGTILMTKLTERSLPKLADSSQGFLVIWSFLFAQQTFTSDWVPSECKLIKQDSDAVTLLLHYRPIKICLNKSNVASWNWAMGAFSQPAVGTYTNPTRLLIVFSGQTSTKVRVEF